MDFDKSSGCEAQVEPDSLNDRGSSDCPCPRRAEIWQGNGAPSVIEGSSINPEPWLNLSNRNSGEFQYEQVGSQEFWFIVERAYHFNLRRAAEWEDSATTNSAEEDGAASESSQDEQLAPPQYRFCGETQERSRKRDMFLVPTPLVRNGLFEQWIFGPCGTVTNEY